MSKVNSIFEVHGRIGNVVFRKRKGKVYASACPSSNKQKVANDPQFARTRENNREFSGMIKLSRAVYHMASMVDASAHTDVFGKLTKQLSVLKGLDTNHDRGNRSFQLTLRPKLLEGFEWNDTNHMSSLFHGNLTATCIDSNVSFSIPAIAPQSDLQIPIGATHYRFVFIVGSVSDVTWNAGLSQYAVANEETDGVRMVSLGDMQDLTTATEATTKSVNLSVTATDCTILANVALLFYQRVNGKDVLLKDQNAMQTVGAWAYDGM